MAACVSLMVFMPTSVSHYVELKLATILLMLEELNIEINIYHSQYVYTAIDG